MDIEKTRYRYLAVLYLFSFFGDIFLRLHLRDLCYTGHNERLKNRDYFSFHIYIRLTLCYNVFSRGILWLKFGRVFNSSPTPSANKKALLWQCFFYWSKRGDLNASDRERERTDRSRCEGEGGERVSKQGASRSKGRRATMRARCVAAERQERISPSPPVRT